MIIGITGLKSSGKDTTGDLICSIDPLFKKESFANILKDMVAILFGWDRGALQGSTEKSRAWREQPDEFWSKKLGREYTPRKALQELGTDVFRNHFFQDIWVAALEKKLGSSKGNYVITDVRFPNEIDMIKQLGGKIIRVERGTLPSWFNEASNYNLFGGQQPEELNNVHPSEWKWIGVDEPDFIFKNNGTISDLGKQVCDMFLELGNVGNQ